MTDETPDPPAPRDLAADVNLLREALRLCTRPDYRTSPLSEAEWATIAKAVSIERAPGPIDAAIAAVGETIAARGPVRLATAADFAQDLAARPAGAAAAFAAEGEPVEERDAFLHNVVAHPLLWLDGVTGTRVGRWLHRRTRPAVPRERSLR